VSSFFHCTHLWLAALETDVRLAALVPRAAVTVATVKAEREPESFRFLLDLHTDHMTISAQDVGWMWPINRARLPSVSECWFLGRQIWKIAGDARPPIRHATPQHTTARHTQPSIQPPSIVKRQSVHS